MSNQQKFVSIILALVAVIVYLFVSAPSELPQQSSAGGGSSQMIPIETVMRLVAAENQAARSLYTGEIVGPGQVAGLAFNEDWRDEGVDAGPLPALFLRETSASLNASTIQLGLFLGSEFPIAISNKFSGSQMEQFERLKASGEPQFFLDEDTDVYTAMFPDYASVQPCVDCHNDHEDSPKTDWQLNDVMGATTWTYPLGEVSVEEALLILTAVRNGFKDAYTAYIEKAQAFSNPPEIGEKWPREGYFLPTPEVFLAEFQRRASPLTVETILAAVNSGGLTVEDVR